MAGPILGVAGCDSDAVSVPCLSQLCQWSVNRDGIHVFTPPSHLPKYLRVDAAICFENKLVNR